MLIGIAMTRWRSAWVALLLLFVLPSNVLAQTAEWDPTGAVAAYSAALNAHDLEAALALFDDTGSATDASGHHFEGRPGLTEFLLGNGFGSPETHISTQNLHVVGNRAVWTYLCSCTAGPTEVREVRLVMSHNKISVFAEMPPPMAPVRRPDTRALPWLPLSALALAVLAAGLGMRRGRTPAPARRATQGRLLAGLVQARATRMYTYGGANADTDR
jgi:ketosteroid isomerase-like protein